MAAETPSETDPDPETDAASAAGGPGTPATAAVDDAMRQLRELLVNPAIAPEREAVRLLREEVRAGRLNARQLADALPEAVRLSSADGERLADALSPTVDRAIELSIENNPQPMVDVIFPIIGPAIRKAVSDALAKAVSGLNETLEHSLSPQSIRWRLEAKRTGKTFAEVLMLKTLRYRVDQVFLVHAKTGLLLHHVVAPGASVRDADLVSGMLTAVTDFVRDSFASDEDTGAGLQKLRVGGTSVWVERGPYAVLAAAVRGEGPEELRETLEESVESIHQRFRDELEHYDGDSGVFVGTAPDLARCLVSAEMPGRRRSAWGRWLRRAAALAVVVGLVFLAIRSNVRWNRLVDELRNTPGVLLVDENHNWWGKSQLTGFFEVRAPVQPYMILNRSAIPSDEVEQRWEPFTGLTGGSSGGAPAAPYLPADPGALLDAPDGVSFVPVAGEGPVRWVSRGDADSAWLATARRQVSAGVGPLAPGSVDLSGVTDRDASRRADAAALRAAVAAVAAVEVPMPEGVDLTGAVARDRLAQAARDVGEAARLARKSGQRFTLEVTGHTDAVGEPDINQALSLARAEAVAAALRARRPADSGGGWVILTRGAGSARPRVAETAPADQQAANRRVTLAVRLEPR